MKRAILIVLTIFFSFPVLATTYRLPADKDALIGLVQYDTTQSEGNTATRIAQQFDVGLNALESANPLLDMSKELPAGSLIQIPSQHLLPNQPRKGIVINLPEMRMYYFIEGSEEVLTYPIGIGKIGKTIPITKTTITRKTTDPTWTPPQDIRDFNLEKGIVLPKVMPPGPDNPLGPYAIYMRLPTYLIHSTIFPESIGTRASFGCIRMYESDIKEFFPSVEKNIPVVIVNAPVKVGWMNKRLYLEAHPGLEEHHDAYNNSLPGVVSLINEVTHDHLAIIDWQRISYIAKERDGIPHEIGMVL